MTMLFVDGMDHYSGTSAPRYKWRGGMSNVAITTHATVGLYGGPALHLSNDDLPISGSWHPYAPRHNIYFSFYRRGQGHQTDQMVRFKEGPVTHVTLRTVFHSNQIQIYRGELATFLVQTAACIYQNNDHDLFECYISLSDAVSEGRVELRINGDLAAEYDGDTREGGFNTGIDSIELVGELGDNYFDDVLVYDDLGPDNNDFLGDYRIQTLWVDAEGTESDWDNPVDTDENYLQIDDQGAGSGASHVISQQTGARDLYEVQAISENQVSPDNVEDILAVQVSHLARRPDAGTRDMIQLLESNGSETRSDVQSGIQPMNTDWQRFSHIVERNPDGDVVWTEAAVAAVQIGQEAGA